MKYILITSLLVLVGCKAKTGPIYKQLDKSGQLVQVFATGEMKGVFRFENNETICYIYSEYNQGGISCKFKEKK